MFCFVSEEPTPRSEATMLQAGWLQIRYTKPGSSRNLSKENHHFYPTPAPNQPRPRTYNQAESVSSFWPKQKSVDGNYKKTLNTKLHGTKKHTKTIQTKAEQN